MQQQPPAVRRDSVGDETHDRQRADILARCARLTEQAGDGNPARNAAIGEALERLVTDVRNHLSAEEALLSRCGHPALEAFRHECEEFEYLMANVATPGNFDAAEILRFVTLWTTGHVAGSPGLGPWAPTDAAPTADPGSAPAAPRKDR